ncbi:MarR family winged helix-turn-helix transcriptional regulator [Halobacteriovorax sp.]|uniref:MarR family winged helix-turn-helix transcriptional regulator n=1 Tax=Halobacteriovorax sp. TaxID=2020862 RepID=UPI003AF1F390
MQELLNLSKVKAWRTLMHAYNQIYRYLESELLKENCSISRFQIFFYLYFQGPLSSIELAQLLNVTRGNISTFVKRLSEDSLVEVHPTKGRGGKQLISLSPKGKSQFENFFPEHIKRVTSVMPEISSKSLKTLSEIQI